MEIQNIVAGYLFSTIAATFLLWLLIDIVGWGYLEKFEIKGKEAGILTMPMGIVERMLFTTAFLINAPSIVGLWVGLKVAVQWSRWSKKDSRGVYNLFLIGTALSIMLSYVGACIAAQSIIQFANT